ncbi:hypothetical protein AB0D57_44590 [Streptomyces sp. NPDC048275]|uniref:hypothetical protein n=1 Tax=Streptomyces sp. NPDC048275 TaxID=3155629 RepID=UPI0033F82326
MKKITSTLAVVGLSVAAAVAAPLLAAAPASATPAAENTSSGCDYVWLYSQANYGGSQWFHDSCNRALQAYPMPVKSIINNGPAGSRLCGISKDSNKIYGFLPGNYNYIGSPFTDSNYMRSTAWNGTFIGTDPKSGPIFVNC